MVLLWIVIAALGLGAGGRQFATHGIYELPLNTLEAPYEIIERLVFKIRGQAYSDLGKISKADPAMIAIQKNLNDSKDTDDVFQMKRGEVFKKEGVCEPWSPESDQCSCDQVCPLSFSLLSINAGQIHVEEQNALRFKNHDYQYWDGHNLGHCWGHAVFTQKIGRLAIFRPEEKAPYEEGSRAWIKFYRKILKKISHDQAQIVPGFKSIEEMSAHPKLFKEFANRISAMWGSHAMTLEGFAQSSVGSIRTNEWYLNYIAELKERLRNFQKPAVYIGPRIPIFGAGQSHVSLVSRVFEKDGITTVCYEDNNATARENQRCYRNDRFNRDGSVVMDPALDLDGNPIPGKTVTAIWYGPKNIVYHENRDTAADMRSLWKLCQKTACRK